MPTLSPDLQPYHQLHGAKTAHHPVEGPCFICEGRFLVDSALDAGREGRLRVISVLCQESLEAEFALKLPEGARLLTASKAELGELLGFAFHRGVLCCVALPTEPDESAILEARRLVVLPHVDNVENLGLILRSAAALGMDAVLVGRGPGPFERRSLRVSMGAAWKLPVLQREDPGPLVEAWRSKGLDSEIVGAALGPASQDARLWRPAPRCALVLGPEAYGLDQDWIQRCDRSIAIPMARGMDSLNVAAAGAILMFRMMDASL